MMNQDESKEFDVNVAQTESAQKPEVELKDASTRMGSQSQPVPLRVAIIGGGIGGLALATFLSSSNLDVTIYESSPSLTELGAGVGVWLRTWRILSSHSPALAADLASIAPEERDMSDSVRKAFEFRRGDRAPEGLSFYTMEVPFGVLTLHRASFQRVLASHALPPAHAAFGKRLVSYEYSIPNDPTSEIRLKFADGSSATADILVGADGIRSVVRRSGGLSVSHADTWIPTLSKEMTDGNGVSSNSFVDSSKGTALESRNVEGDVLADLTEPVWSGTHVYRNLIPLEALEARFPGHRATKGPVVYFGKNKHVLAFPLTSSQSPSGGSSLTPIPMVNLVAYTSSPSLEGTRLPPGEPWVHPAPSAELLAKFEGWEEEVQALLELAKNPLLWAVHTVKPLPRYTDAFGRVVLVGDAAHAMTPHQGAGGGQAIEDAYVLAALLSHPLTTRSTLPHALRAYDAVRVPVSQGVVRSSRLNGMMYEFNSAWDNADIVTQETNTNVDGTVQQREEGDGGELERLQRLAADIMDIHKWEWEDEPVPEQRQHARAVKLFEKAITNAKEAQIN